MTDHAREDNELKSASEGRIPAITARYSNPADHAAWDDVAYLLVQLAYLESSRLLLVRQLGELRQEIDQRIAELSNKHGSPESCGWHPSLEPTYDIEAAAAFHELIRLKDLFTKGTE